jgi:Dna[CI] antecedent, DciA
MITFLGCQAVSKKYFRIPREYDGTQVTTRSVVDLLPQVLSKIGDVYHQQADLLLAGWPEIIGPKLATMTQAVSFIEGVLLVKVKNSTLHSLLSQHDKLRILTLLRKKFTQVEIKNIHFRMG